jgi:cyclohexanecarboxyl-CoA dehydrogenase
MEGWMVFFSDEQKSFCAWVRAFAANELSDGAGERQKLEYIAPEVFERLAGAGLLEMGVRPYAKRPTDFMTLGIAMEEICKVDYSAMIVLLIQVVVYGLAEYMTKELREDVLPAAAAGKRLLCFANTEPDCGSDAAAITTKAVRDGDHYVINGEKTSISGGMQSNAVFMTARTGPETGVKGVTLFYVPLDAPGVSRSLFHDMGNTTAGRASLIFDGVRVPSAFRIGNEGEGFTKVMRTFDASRVLVALSALGLAEASMAEAIAYVKRRTAFGNALSKYEAISFRLAEHATLLEAARMLCYKALKLRDEGLPHSKEAAMTKWFAPKCAVDATHDILVMIGSKGYTDEYLFEQRWRDAMSCLLGDGTGEIMKVITARGMLGSQFAPSI